MQMYP